MEDAAYGLVSLIEKRDTIEAEGMVFWLFTEARQAGRALAGGKCVLDTAVIGIAGAGLEQLGARSFVTIIWVAISVSCGSLIGHLNLVILVDDKDAGGYGVEYGSKDVLIAYVKVCIGFVHCCICLFVSYLLNKKYSYHMLVIFCITFLCNVGEDAKVGLFWHVGMSGCSKIGYWLCVNNSERRKVQYYWTFFIFGVVKIWRGFVKPFLMVPQKV